MKKDNASLIRSDGFQTLLSSLVCILGGLVVGYIVLLLIEPSGAFEAILAVMKSFFRYPGKLMLKYFGQTLVRTVPLLMCALSVLFAYKVGMFNIGAAENSMTTTGCYYSFDWGDANFAVLNTNDMYPMSAAQINWLKNDMNASNAQWKIVLMHRALYSAGKNINKPDTVIMRNLLLPVIDELGIDVVFAGHDHMYMRTETVKGEKVQDVQTVTEIWNGESTTFAVNPDGTTHILPSTAGTKRYGVNEEAMPPILESAALARDTKDGGVFATVSLDSNHFVYKAYMVDDETGEKSLIDTYAIKKTDRESINEDYVDLPTDIGSTAGQHGITFVVEIVKMLVSYIELLFSLF